MTFARYLVDTSALVRLVRDPQVRADWREQIGAGVLASCPVVELEFFYSARSRTDRDRLEALLGRAFSWVPMLDQAWDRAAEIQNSLIDRGTHRSAGMVDLLVAATAELHNLVLLHHDRDFEQIAAVTGLSTRWLARPAPSGPW